VIAVDAGLLVLGVNRYAPEHARAAELLESLANGDDEWALPWSAVHEFLAFVTHPYAVARVLGADDAWGFIHALAASPVLRFLGPTERHAEACAEVLALRDPAVPGGLDPSFETAVLLREHGVRELLSTDPGMRRWRFLDVRDPVKGEPWSPGVRPARRYRTLTRRKSSG
jgi:predicted nucleic acid-binding protein